MSLESGHYETRVFTAASAARNPGRLLRMMWTDIVSGWELARMLAVRDLKAQYRQSILGFLWAFIPPVFWAVGLTVAKENKFVNIDPSSSLNLGAYVMISVALWQMFSTSLRGPLDSLHTNRTLLTRVTFPREVIIVADLLKQLFAVLINLIVIAATFIYYQIPVQPTAVLAVPAMVGIVILGTGLGMFLAPVGLLYKDITNSLPIVMTIWMFFTPVVFSENKYEGLFATAVRWNPVTPVLVTTRQLVTGEALTLLPQFCFVVVLSGILMVVGMALLRIIIPVIAERWGL